MWGWGSWCDDNDFHTDRLNQSFTFELSEKARVLHLYDVEQLKDLPRLDSELATWCCLDFEKLLAEGWDAVELHLSEEKSCCGFLEGLYWQFYGWDCDSILIMNPDVVEVV